MGGNKTPISRPDGPTAGLSVRPAIGFCCWSQTKSQPKSAQAGVVDTQNSEFFT